MPERKGVRNSTVTIKVEMVEQKILLTTIATPKGRTNADLADRVKTMLGPIVNAMDLPRIHVMAEGTRVLLHGDVANETDASVLEEVVKSLPEVTSVESHLHVGLLPGDTRPSDAADDNQSEMMGALLGAAEAIGITGGPARSAVWGTLSAILEQIPPNERRHVISHFPDDVAVFAKPRQHFGDENLHWKTELALDVAASLRGGIDLPSAEVLVPLVIGVLRRFVPEEDRDVQATLHTALKDLWRVSVTP
jgi:BON domain